MRMRKIVGIAVVIVVSILVLYTIMSPYQNCKRDGGGEYVIDICIKNTSW